MVDINVSLVQNSNSGSATSTSFSYPTTNVRYWVHPSYPGLRTIFFFPELPVPPGATIDSAVLTLRASSTNRTIPFSVGVKAELSTNAAKPANITEYNAKTWSSTITWGVTETSQWPAGDVNSPDLKTIIAAVVQQVGWEANKPLVLGVDTDGEGRAEWVCSSTYLPSLAISYTPETGITYYAEINESLGFRYASVDTNMMEYLAQSIGLGASFDTNMREVESTLGLLASFIGSYQYYSELSLGVKFSADAIGSYQYEGVSESGFGLSADAFASFQYSKEITPSFSLSAAFGAEIYIVLNGDLELAQLEFVGLFSSAGGVELELPLLDMAGVFLGAPWSGEMVLEFPAVHATDYKGLVMAGRFGSVLSASFLPLSMRGVLSSGRVISGSWILKGLESAGYFGAFGAVSAEPLRCSGQLTVRNLTVGALSLLPLSCSGTLTADHVPADLSGVWSLQKMVLAGALQNAPFWTGAMQVRKLSFAGQLVTPDSWVVSCRLRALSISGMIIPESGMAGTLVIYPLEMFGTVSVPIPKAGWYRISRFKSGIYGEYVENKLAFTVVIEAEVEHP